MNTEILGTPLEQAAYAAVGGAGDDNIWQAVIAAAEKGAICAALDQCGYKQTDAAELLGVSRTTFRERLGRYGLKRYRGKQQA